MVKKKIGELRLVWSNWFDQEERNGKLILNVGIWQSICLIIGDFMLFRINPWALLLFSPMVLGLITYFLGTRFKLVLFKNGGHNNGN